MNRRLRAQHRDNPAFSAGLIPIFQRKRLFNLLKPVLAQRFRHTLQDRFFDRAGLQRNKMLRQLLFGGAICLGNIAIHALAMVFVISAARTAAAKHMTFPKTRLVAVMIAVVSVLLIAHVAEIAVWSIGYALVEAAPEGTDRLYFAFVNFTTLGYGDVVPLPRWRLLGPMTAMNGVLLFGWSTAVMFEVLRTTLRLPSPE